MRAQYAVAVPAAVIGALAACVWAGAPAHAAVASVRATQDTPAQDTPAHGPAEYRVAAGDTVIGIAGRFGLRTADVLAWNRLGWSSVIRPGQLLRLTPPPRPRPRPAPRAAHTSYAVRAGDTVAAIARRFHTSTQAVLLANRLSWSSIIYPGQTLVVPDPVDAPAPTAAVVAPAAATYVVQAGDTVSAIAAAHGVSVTALLAANDLSWSSIIYPGQHLRAPVGIPGLTAEQTANAELIVRVGRALGVPDRGIAIALGTAMQESGLRNLPGGDRDSGGLFQQRPSTGWGTAAQVRDPQRATRAFFGGPHDPNGTRTRGLLDVPGWQDMSFADAAQAVQLSAYPALYARWEHPAQQWLAAIGR